MKAMKKKAVSKIAKGTMAKYAVFSGTKAKTSTGLTKSDLTQSKSGKIEQEEERPGQEGVCADQGLDSCCSEGKEGSGREGFRRCQGHPALQEGKGALPVST